ncbi:MAG: sigma-70 family RNA polymerase sigma factor [Deltaproteobacteria bacterium]|nr:sigma-70 family RNA polymerase sigma factor [Deltaproteobacteria bacterium]
MLGLETLLDLSWGSLIPLVWLAGSTLFGKESSRQEDQELVTAVRAGDPTAYRGLVEKYQNRVYHLIYGMVRNQEDARDLAQDVFVKAYHRLDSFRLESSFYTWLYRIAMNQAIDFIRRRKRQGTTTFDEGVASRDDNGEIAAAHHEDSPSHALERKRLYKRIMDAMEELPEDQRQVLLLREVEGLAYKDIADIMDIPEGTVMSRLYYARKKLQKLLADER